MLATTATILIAFIAVAVFLFVARRVFRLALKFALVGVLLLILIAGAMIGWWRGWFGSSSPRAERPAQSNQRGNLNRRSPSR